MKVCRYTVRRVQALHYLQPTEGQSVPLFKKFAHLKNKRVIEFQCK